MPTVRDVLALDVFRRADAEVVAGRDYLDRKVRWVHISELTDVAHLLKGGELLLTTGMGLAERQDLQRQYIRELADTGIAGVVLRLGRSFTRLPDALIDEAELRQLPFIALHREIRYVEVTEQVHSAIISRQYQLLEKAEKIGRDFTELLLGGASLKRIVHRLADIVENAVVLEDAAHQIIEFGRYGRSLDDVLQEWELHSRSGHAWEKGDSSVKVQNTDPACAWIPITLRSENRGRLHVLQADTPLDEMDYVAIDRAAAAVGLALLAEQEAGQWSEHARGALLTDILEGGYASPDEIYRRARGLGARLEGKRLAVAVVEARDFGDLVAERKLSERDRQLVRTGMLNETRLAAGRAGCECLAALEADRVVAVVGLPSQVSVRGCLEKIGRDISTRIPQALEKIVPVVGLSDEVGLEALRRGIEEAREAVRYGVSVGQGSPVYHFGDLGLHQLLLRMRDGPELARFVEAELGPILERDAKSVAPLLPTLRTFLRARSVASAAKSLNIERRSVYHRLDRISELLKCDLEDAETRTKLILALSGLELLQRGRAKDHAPQRRRGYRADRR